MMAERPFSGPDTIPGQPSTATDRPIDARGTVREAVGIFDSEEALQGAIDDLAMAGFAQHELSLMASDAVARERLGAAFGSVDAAKDDPDAPRRSVIAPEEVGSAQGVAIGIPAYVGAILATGAVIATGGTALAAAAAAALAGGAGGGLGALVARWIGEQRHSLLQQHLDKGGILLWVNLRDESRTELARGIMGRHTSHPVEIHTIPQATG